MNALCQVGVMQKPFSKPCGVWEMVIVLTKSVEEHFKEKGLLEHVLHVGDDCRSAECNRYGRGVF